MKVGNNPKDWGDFVCPKGKSKISDKIIGKVLKLIIEATLHKRHGI